jgi:hypothetical protein
MANRYNYTQKTKRWDGKAVYKTLNMPNIPFSLNDIYIISQEGMFLDELAYKYYKDPTLWTLIAQANSLGKGRLSVPAGLQLRIPVNPSVYLNNLKSENL